MNFEEFKQQLMEDLKEALSRRVGTEVAVEENEVQKLQQESYEGIVIRKKNESIGVDPTGFNYYLGCLEWLRYIHSNNTS